MYFQTEFLRASATWDVGGTYRLDLPSTGYLSAIILHVKGTPVTDAVIATEKWRLQDYISKIEVIANGSTPLKSYTGQVSKFLTWFAGGTCSPDKAFNYGSSTHRFHTMIPFGRKLFDPSMGLDLSKYNSVELALTNDATSSQYSAITVDIICIYQRDVVGNPYSGFLKTEEWRKWTTVQAKWEYNDLPTELRIRNVIIQTIADVSATMNADTTPYNVAYDIECYLKTGLLKVFDGNLRDLWYLNAFDPAYREVFAALEPYNTSAYGVHTGLGQTLGIGGARLNHSSAQSSYGTTITPGDDGQTLSRLAATENDQDAWLALGLSLENCAWLRFNHVDEPMGYLDPDQQKMVQMNIQTRDAASAADGTIRLILDRYVPY